MRASYGLFLLALATPAFAASDWTRAAPFEAPASELREAAAAAQPDEKAIALLYVEERWRIDDEGRTERKYRMVYQVRAESAIRAWGHVNAEWDPWYQERPELEARVLDVDGGEQFLQPEGIRESPVGRDDLQTFTERRRVQALIPGVAVGAVVETLITWRDRDPYFSGGRSLRIGLDGTGGAPMRVVVDAPAAHPVSWELQAEGVKVRERTRRGRRIIEAFAPSPPEAEWRDLALPAQVDPRPHLRVSVAGDWNTIATEYAKIIDKSADTAGIEDLVEEVRSAGDGRDERLAAAVAIARDRVRYTALALGMQSIVPWGPAETAQRGYGDCKDKATLLVTLLRAVGIEADLALVRSVGIDFDPKFPALEAFDHVIVRVGGGSIIWVDPTASHTAVGALPVHLEGRFALIVREGERAPIRLPRSSATDNVIRINYIYEIPPNGGASLQATFASTGWVAETYRAGIEHRTAATTRAWAERWSAHEVRQGTLTSVERAGWGTDEPVASIQLAVADTEGCAATTLRASCKLNFGVANSWLPGVVTTAAADANEGEPLPDPLADRAAPFVALPHRVEVRAEVRFDPILVPLSVPESKSIQLGDAPIGVEWRYEPGRLIGHATLDTGDGLFTAEEARALRSVWLDSPMMGMYTLEFEAEPMAMLARGERVAAFDRIDALIAAQPTSSYYRRIRVAMLSQLGLMGAALADAEAGVSAEPDDALAWLTLGVLRTFDSFGRERTPPYDRAGAIVAFERALELDPTLQFAEEGLARCYLVGGDGFRTVHRPDLERALALLDARAGRGLHDLDVERVAIRLQLGWAAELAKDLPADGEAALVARIVEAALKGGVSAGVAVAERAPRERRWTAAGKAATMLSSQGFIALGRGVAQHAMSGGMDDPRLRQFATSTAKASWEEHLAAATELERAHLSLVAAGFPGADSEAIYARHLARADVHSAKFRGYAAAMRELPLAAREAVSDPRNLYLFGGHLSVLEPTAAGWRVRQHFTRGGFYDTWYILEDGTFKLYHADDLGSLASAAMWHLDHGRIDAARELLALELGSPTSIQRWSRFEPSAEAPALTRVPDDDDELAFAVTLVLAREGDRGALAQLRQTYSSTDSSNKVAVRRALFDGSIRAEDVEGAVAAYAELSDQERRMALVCEAIVGTLTSAARLVEAREALAACEGSLSAQDFQRTNARILLAEGERDEGLAILLSLATRAEATSYDLNGYAWHALIHDVDIDRALAFARRAADSRPNESGVVHTLACLLARNGSAREAMEQRERYLTLTQAGSADRGGASLVLGLLAEVHGLENEARAAYQAVPRSVTPGASWSIAERRLSALDARSSPP